MTRRGHAPTLRAGRPAMTDTVTIRAEWDDEAAVWVVTSADVPGLVVEADTYDEIERKALLVIEDLADFEPDIAALLGHPLDIVAVRHATVRKVA